MAAVEEKQAAGITYLHRAGHGDSVVLLHGIGSNAWSFSPVIDLLPEGLDVIAWNNPGYEKSAPLDPRWPTEDDYAERLLAFLDALGLHCVTLVGHSLGSLIGARFAKTHPDRVARLIIASAASGYQVEPRTALPAKAAKRLEDRELLGTEEFARRRAPNLVFEPELNPELVGKVRDAMVQIRRRGYTQATKMLASGRLEDSLRGVSAPTHFIIGVNDNITPEIQTFKAARARAEAGGVKPEIVRIKRAGHAVHQQKPKEFAAHVARFMGIAAKHEEGAGNV